MSFYTRSKEGRSTLIEIREVNQKEITLKFLDEGSTGIRNNGMTIRYDGTPQLKIHFGRPSGLGFLINGPVRLFAGSELSLIDSQSLDGEVFTANRAGFGYLARTLKKKLPQIQNSELGELVVTRVLDEY